MLSGECDYVLTLNNRIVSLYRNEMLVFRTTLTSYKHDAVSVGIMGMHTKASDSSKITIDAGTELATMTNIKIYIGAYTSANGDAEDEDFGGEAPNDENLILALDNLADTSNSVTGDKAASIEKTPNCAYSKVNTDGTVQATEQQQWYRYGVVTDIPLTMSSQYVVTFKAKHFADDPSGNDVLAFIFTGTDWKNTQAIHYNEVNYFVADYKQWSTNAVNGDKVSQPNRMTEEVEYTLTLNRGMVSLYREGALVFATKMQSFKDDVLSIGLMGYKPTVPDVGTNISIMTDIKVYNAVFESDKVENGKTITFLNTDGTVLHTKDYIQRWIIKEFPKTTSASDGTVIKWFYKGTNTIVKSPYIVTDNAVIEARELTLALTDVKAAQCTAPADNTQSVRFIASAQTLQATNVGFVIEAKYKENVEGTEIIRTRKWEITSTKVYTSILATENGTVSTVTASELGGVYLTALSVNNVPTNIGQIDFYVTSFITVNDERITSGEPTVFTMVNGTFDNSISLLS